MKGPVYQKSMEFSLKAIEVYHRLQSKNEVIMSKQLLASATSIGANIREASAASSRKDFINKMTIASKEAREASYWLELIHQSNIINMDLTGLLSLNNELIKLLTSIVLTSKKRTME
jgi:four helix bundle protein